MFLRDINNDIVQVGDYLVYATDGHGSTPNLGIARVDLIRWFRQPRSNHPLSQGSEPKVRCHIIKHSAVAPGNTVWLQRVDRMVRIRM